MTNGEKFKTASERRKEYQKYCAYSKKQNLFILDEFNWLELEYKGELKPCPFCGGEYVNTYKCNNTDIWYVACGKCGVRTEGDTSKEMAISAWNRRAK